MREDEGGAEERRHYLRRYVRDEVRSRRQPQRIRRREAADGVLWPRRAAVQLQGEDDLRAADGDGVSGGRSVRELGRGSLHGIGERRGCFKDLVRQILGAAYPSQKSLQEECNQPFGRGQLCKMNVLRK